MSRKFAVARRGFESSVSISEFKEPEDRRGDGDARRSGGKNLEAIETWGNPLRENTR